MTNLSFVPVLGADHSSFPHKAEVLAMSTIYKAFSAQSSQGLMTRTSVASKSRLLRVASGTSRVRACAAIKLSNWRDPTRWSAISTCAANSPQRSAVARSNGTIRSLWCSFSRSSHGSNNARLAAPGVLRMPTVNSATTIVDSKVSSRWLHNQSTTRLLGFGLVSSLKTLVSTKIIILERDYPFMNRAQRKPDFNTGASHGNQLVHPIIIAAILRHCLVSILRFRLPDFRPIHGNMSPFQVHHSIRVSS